MQEKLENEIVTLLDLLSKIISNYVIEYKYICTYKYYHKNRKIFYSLPRFRFAQTKHMERHQKKYASRIMELFV